MSSGADLEYICNAFQKKCELYGIEISVNKIKSCLRKNIQVSITDLESESLPYQDSFFDLVISNQTYEHLKNIFWCISEVVRILKPGGHFIIGVPNLASPHCSLPLLIGKQPIQIKTHGPHVRGFTLDGIKDLLLSDGYFSFKEYAGSGFYPFPLKIAVQLARIFPSHSTSIFCSFQRTEKMGSFIEEFKANYHYETSYYLGIPAKTREDKK